MKYSVVDYRHRAKEHLQNMGKHPGMYASNREAFLTEVTGILGIFNPKFTPIPFIINHTGRVGCSYKDLDIEVESDWGRKVIDDALIILESTGLVYSDFPVPEGLLVSSPKVPKSNDPVVNYIFNNS